MRFNVLLVIATFAISACDPNRDEIQPPVPEGFVDLGLSVYWASCNLGASTPEGNGLYFQWGDTVGYSSNNDKYFDWLDQNGNVSYKWCNGSVSSLTKYTFNREENTGDGKIVLETADDAAWINLNGEGRIPTKEEWEELFNIDNCTWTWTTVNEVNGYKVQSKKSGFTDNWIFLPAAGYQIMDYNIP